MRWLNVDLRILKVWTNSEFTASPNIESDSRLNIEDSILSLRLYRDGDSRLGDSRLRIQSLSG